MAPTLSDTAIRDALVRLGVYRVKAAQAVADEHPNDLISGAVMLTLGLRESNGRNINNQADTDHGCFQISELYHYDFLHREPGCPEGGWRVEEGHTADESGYCPRYTPALIYAEGMLREDLAYGRYKGIPKDKRLAFALAAYNAGKGGAWNGYRDGNVDHYTTGGDYSSWVISHAKRVQGWLDKHPNWRPEES